MPLSRVKPEQYEELLHNKVDTVIALLAPLGAPAPEVFQSPPTGFRQRAEFRIWHEGDDLNYVMFRRDDPKTPVNVTEFPIADERIRSLMPRLRALLKHNTTLRRKLFQAEFLATLSGELLVTLAYHRKLEQDWEEAAAELRAALSAACGPVALIGRSRKQKIVLGEEYVTEVLPVDGREYRYRQYEQAFTQPNARVNIQMIEWACAQAAGLSGDLLELYCGNGNFTLPLSRHFNRLLATEVAKVSVRAARHNIADNDIDNIDLVRLSAEEVTQAMAGERVFRRLAELPQPLGDYQLDTVFVDPPRAGMDAATTAMTAGFKTIIYISCNPHTLAANLQTLSKTHAISALALFDQFPYTDHMECGVVLRRKA
ncbi:MAG: tRNA (uridine(54)-C5)-methyltransferase TrmA [Halioglobus sp.]|nr:tRNA (uridine(54)-C5)-methyltransferase TrmA [Halioglobus sp.]